jgi:hypothetical protein
MCMVAAKTRLKPHRFVNKMVHSRISKYHYLASQSRSFFEEVSIKHMLSGYDYPMELLACSRGVGLLFYI